MITSAAKVADTDMLTRVAHCLHRHHWQFGCLLGQFVTNISTFKHFQYGEHFFWNVNVILQWRFYDKRPMIFSITYATQN